MKYENVCPLCGALRISRQKSTRICGSCARTLVWDQRRLASLHDLIHRTQALTSIFQAMQHQSAGVVRYMDLLETLERDVAHLANDVMVAQLAISEKGVAA